MRFMHAHDFNTYLEDKVKSTIESYKLLKPSEKIAVALSGGKDSVLTLHLLNKFRKAFNFELVAISVDEGISGYRSEGIKIAEENAVDLGVEFIRRSFREEFGFKVDDIPSLYKSACIPCGVFRRYLLNKTAYEVGASKIATGHNLDDEVQSYLMSFARADFRKFGKFGPKLDTIHPRLIPRIKPLWNIPEEEIKTYVSWNNMKVQLGKCPYSHMSLRSKIRDFLNKMEAKKPGIKAAMLESFKKTFKPHETFPKLYECEKCGETSSSKICKVCEMMHDINKVI